MSDEPNRALPELLDQVLTRQGILLAPADVLAGALELERALRALERLRQLDATAFEPMTYPCFDHCKEEHGATE